MAKIARAQLWKHPGFPGLIVVTTNATLKTDGRLVMGRGAALQAREKIPDIDLECGTEIKKTGSEYGFALIRPPCEDKVGFGIFQVKYDYDSPASLRLIDLSARLLAGYAMLYPETSIRLNYPGIGNGKLSMELVEPLLEVLPDNVTVCYLEE